MSFGLILCLELSDHRWGKTYADISNRFFLGYVVPSRRTWYLRDEFDNGTLAYFASTTEKTAVSVRWESSKSNVSEQAFNINIEFENKR